MNYETNYSEISTNQGKSNPFAAIDRDTDLATLLRSGMFVQTMGGKYGVVAGDKIVFQDGTFTERKCRKSGGQYSSSPTAGILSASERVRYSEEPRTRMQSGFGSN